MNQEIKNKWLIALRSGEYKQGKEYLESKDSSGKTVHCCLGVLARCQGMKPTRRGIAGNKEELPSDTFLKLCGFDKEVAYKLAGMNDGDAFEEQKPQSFKQIANWIERNL